MKRLDGVEIGALIVLMAGIVLAVLHWESVERMFGYVLHEQRQQPAAAASAPPVMASAPIASAPASAPAQLQLPAASQPLPSLAGSDHAFGGAVASLVGHGAFAQWWVPDQLIVHLVSTIDNLARAQAPVRAWPVKPAPGQLQVRAEGAQGNAGPPQGSLTPTGGGVGAAQPWGPSEAVLDDSNYARYAPYMAWLRRVDPARTVAVYLDFYPLFQQAWRELGYPKGQFNDRLLQVIDNLLAAPEPNGPIRLVQPHVLYRYADPGLESASAGQKILMRIGPANAREVKAKLRALRSQLLLHMHAASAAASAPSPAASR